MTFFVEWVLGLEFYAKGDKDCLCSSYNMDLMGKSFVVFEELPVMNKNEWNMCDSKLKDMATGSEMNYSDKYQKKVRTANMNNYIILTNHKAVKRPDGRRYHVITINTKYCNDHEYFADLRETCFNAKVGYAFYNYLMELDTDDFNSLDMPNTTAKLDMVADLLSPIEKFLKYEFLLPKLQVKLKIKELYSRYEKYCGANELHVETPAEFRSGMKQYGFDFKTISGYNCYRISLDQLQTVAEKRKWLHDLDKDFAGEDDPNIDISDADISDKSVDLSVAYSKLLRKYNQLLDKVNGVTRKGFGVMFIVDDIEEALLQDEDDDVDVDDEPIVKKDAGFSRVVGSAPDGTKSVPLSQPLNLIAGQSDSKVH